MDEISPRVYRGPSDAVNLSRYNSLDKRLRLNVLKCESSSNQNAAYPFHLSDDRRFICNARSDAPYAATSPLILTV